MEHYGWPRWSQIGAVCCLAVLGVFLLVSGCTTTPVTQRRQMLLIPESQEIAMGARAYQQILAEEPLSTNQELAALVDRVGRRIAAVAGRPDYQWEFRLIASPEQNAFALPGGKVAVYEGILPVCQNEAGLAVVMSHEIAHALARHGGERMSQEAVVSVVEETVRRATQDRDEQKRLRIMMVYGLGTKYGILLPYSRGHESEADEIGLTLMARAGYDPAEAPRFWERFAGLNEGAQAPEILSTHPADERRASDLARLLPKAQQEYARAPTKHGLGIAFAVPQTSSAGKIQQVGGEEPQDSQEDDEWLMPKNVAPTKTAPSADSPRPSTDWSAAKSPATIDAGVDE